MTCPNCGQSVREGLAVCPFCGVDMATGKVPKPPIFVPQQVQEGATLGCGLSFLLFIAAGFIAIVHGITRDAHNQRGVPVPDSWPAWIYPALQALPVLTITVLYIVVRRRKPLFARGLLYSVFVTLALSLGALAVCR